MTLYLIKNLQLYSLCTAQFLILTPIYFQPTNKQLTKMKYIDREEDSQKIRRLYQKRLIATDRQYAQTHNSIKYKCQAAASRFIDGHNSPDTTHLEQGTDRYANIWTNRLLQKSQNIHSSSINSQIRVEYICTEPISSKYWNMETRRCKQTSRIMHSSEKKHRSVTSRERGVDHFRSRPKTTKGNCNTLQDQKPSLIEMIEELKLKVQPKNSRQGLSSGLKQKARHQFRMQTANMIIHQNKERLKTLGYYRNQKYKQSLKKHQTYTNNLREAREEPEHWLEREVQINPWVVNDSEY